MNDAQTSIGVAAEPVCPPESDVSAGVGIVGALGLIGWIVFCRNYGAFADFFEIPGPHSRLAGPYAALAAMVFSAGPMVIWSLLIDKVHRRASTGIDWQNPRPISAVVETSVVKLAGLWSTWAIIGFLYCVGRWYWSGQYLFAMEIIGLAVIPLFLLSIPYVLWLERVVAEPRDDAWNFGAMLIAREAWDAHKVKKHWRSWGIKAFFGAFMISILPGGFAEVVNADFSGILSDPVRLAFFLIALLFVVDVQIGTVGYLVTMRPLDAHIRSGNPLLAGWLAALICYPPMVFAFMGGNGIFAYEVNTAGWTHWFGASMPLLWVWAALLVVLTGIYAWATMAFGLRFSNLTYRGVLTNGPYRFTRHPAYVSKNLFWWLSVLPFLVTSGSLVDVVRNTFFLGCVSAIYFWRAKTEEAHLLGEDEKYREYHAWMEQHGLLTRPLSALSRRLRSRRSAPVPATR